MGSLEVPMILRARKRLYLSLTERQREILIGCVLGDAYISKLGKIRIEHSLKQCEYLAWKFSKLKTLCYRALPRNVIHKYKGKSYESSFFQLRQYFRKWRSIFYCNGQKIFPKNLILSPLSVAIWYMDDGCWTGKKFVISTESFKGEYLIYLQNVLKKQFGLETNVSKNGKLTILKVSHLVFIDLISPHIIPSMSYKLPNPVTTFPVVVPEGASSNMLANTLAPESINT